MTAPIILSDHTRIPVDGLQFKRREAIPQSWFGVRGHALQAQPHHVSAAALPVAPYASTLHSVMVLQACVCELVKSFLGTPLDENCSVVPIAGTEHWPIGPVERPAQLHPLERLKLHAQNHPVPNLRRPPPRPATGLPGTFPHAAADALDIVFPQLDIRHLEAAHALQAGLVALCSRYPDLGPSKTRPGTTRRIDPPRRPYLTLNRPGWQSSCLAVSNRTRRVIDCQWGTVITQTCADGHKVKRWNGCGTLNCGRCARAVADRRGRRAFRRIGRVDLPMGVVVLTLPPALRHHVRFEQRKAWMRRAFRVVEEWMAMCIGEPAAKLGAGVWFHPVGDDDDKNDEHEHPPKTHPHWNVCFPLVVDVNGKVRKVSKWREPEQLEMLRWLWGREVHRATGEAMDHVNAFYNYRIDDDEKRFTLRYMARPFPGYAEWCEGRSTWQGLMGNARWGKWRAQLDDVGLILAPPIPVCPKCGKAIVCTTVGDRSHWPSHCRSVEELTGHRSTAPPKKGNDLGLSTFDGLSAPTVPAVRHHGAPAS